ncbi:MAG: hypothetical protein WCO96_03765 [Actinomycetes bacterium]
MPDKTNRTLNGAAAGAAAAFVWAASEPLDKPIFNCRYSDVELLGKGVTRGPLWRPIGLLAHLFNGALFGAVYANLAPKLPGPGLAKGIAAGMTEHLLSWPAVAITDRFHPARDELVTMKGNANAFRQATWRHLLFGAALGVVEAKLNPPEPTVEPPNRGADEAAPALNGASANGSAAPTT